MALESLSIWILIAAGLVVGLLAILGLLYAYLQVHHGFRIRSPFAPPRRGLFYRLKRTRSPLTKLHIAYRWLYIKFIHPRFRALFTRPKLISTALYHIPVIRQLFLGDYPLVEIDPKLESNQEGHLNMKYKVSNIGSKSLSNLLLSHRVYDAHGRSLGGPGAPLNYRRLTPISLDPGDTTVEFRVPLEKSVGFESRYDEWNIIEEDTPTPIYIEMSASPGIGHRFLGDMEIFRFDPYPDRRPVRETWAEV